MTPKSFFVREALTRWSDRVAAWSRQSWTGNHAACRVRGHVRHGPHGVAGALIVHSYTIGEGLAHCVVGLTIMAANLLWLPTGILKTAHRMMYFNTGQRQ